MNLDGNAIDSLDSLLLLGDFGPGDTLSLGGNPLSCETQSSKLEALEAKGVTLVSDCPSSGIDCDGTLEFANAAIENQIRLAIDKPSGDLTRDDVAELTSLKVNGYSLVSL